MRKTYILDTSVLINNPNSFKDFENSTIIIPIAVIDELDKLKKQMSAAGASARIATRALDEISGLGDISTGILLDNDILLKIDVNTYEMSSVGDTLFGDPRILACAIHWNKETGGDVIVVSNDLNLRIRSRAEGIIAEGYTSEKSVDELYSGCKIIEHPEAAEDLINNGYIDPRCFQFELLPHEFVIFTDSDGTELAFGRKVSFDKVKQVKKSYPWDVAPKNKEQVFAIDLMNDPNVSLVTMVGSAGCGKTLITIASALDLVLNKNQYDKFIIYRPIQPVGNDIGYLPGDASEKLMPWFQAIYDHFEYLFTPKGKIKKGVHSDKWRVNFEAATKNEKVQLEAITYIRGRSIPNAIILVDEAQNISKEDMKTILTRVGDNTKIILTGDISQIDNRSLDPINNGLAYALEKFKVSELAGHITFTKGERSDLATEAAKLL